MARLGVALSTRMTDEGISQLRQLHVPWSEVAEVRGTPASHANLLRAESPERSVIVGDTFCQDPEGLVEIIRGRADRGASMPRSMLDECEARG